MERESILIDLRYAMRQLREYGDLNRALDALERIESQLTPGMTDEEADESWAAHLRSRSHE